MSSNDILVVSLIDLLATSIEEKNKEVFFNKYYQLRNLSIDKTTPKIIQSYKNLLKKGIALFSFVGDNFFKLLSCARRTF